MGERKSRKRKNGWGFRSIVIGLLLVIVAILILIMLRVGELSDAKGTGLERSVRASLGQLEGKTAEEIQAELNRVIEEGMFHISINTDPVFSNGEAMGNLEIENVPNNRYTMRVEIRLDETGELVYDSGLIDPNYHVQRDDLTTPLEAGNYPATVTFYAYDMDTMEEMGSVMSRITIHVLY